jgi:hypothetical protein
MTDENKNNNPAPDVDYSCEIVGDDESVVVVDYAVMTDRNAELRRLIDGAFSGGEGVSTTSSEISDAEDVEIVGEVGSDVVVGISYAISSQPARLAEARRRALLTPEPTAGTLIDLRYLRLKNHLNAGRKDEVQRILEEFGVGGEYAQAYRDLMSQEGNDSLAAAAKKVVLPAAEPAPDSLSSIISMSPTAVIRAVPSIEAEPEEEDFSCEIEGDDEFDPVEIIEDKNPGKESS